MAKKVEIPEEDARLLKHLDEVDAYMTDFGFDVHDVEPHRETGVTMCKYTSSQSEYPVHVSFPLEKARLSDKDWTEWFKGFKKHMEDTVF